MEYYFAPMEGVTGAIYRTVHHRFFPQVDRYYMPFLSPTQDHVFTPRELRNILPEHNLGFQAVPQLLTKNADDFLWAAGELFAMGYEEVNLNLGCPSGTVTAKGKGAGMLADPAGLDRFLDQVFSAVRGSVSVKTRLGMEEPEEFGPLLEIFGRYPISLLIIHPRVRQDFYRRPVRLEEFDRALESYRGPVCYNGGLVSPQDCRAFAARRPQVSRLMLGQGLLADPALVRQCRGGPPPAREELRAFHDQLYASYLEVFANQRAAVFHMKEVWSYLSRLFQGREKAMKAIKKAAGDRDYRGAVEEMFRLPLLERAAWPEEVDWT